MPFLSAVIAEGVFSARPAAGHAGYVYFATDTKQTFRDNGITWDDVSDKGIVTSVAGRTGDVVVAESDVTNLTTDLAAKASLASPAFTGTPAAPTAAGGTNTTQIATTAFVESRITTLINAAPSALDTLGEIATQLASDESAAGALTTAVSLKAPIASPALTGTPTAPTPSTADNSTKLATTAYVQAQGFGTGSGTVTHTGGALTSGLPVLGAGGADVVIGTKTGTGDVVFATSPTLVTADLGTPSAAVLTNATGLPLATAVTGIMAVANGGTGTSSPGIVAGTNVTVSGAWPNQTVNASTTAGSGLASRTTTAVTTASLANLAVETGSITIAKSFTLIKVVVSCKARVQLYSTAAARTADAGRATGTAPTAGTQHGVIVDLYLSDSAQLSWIHSPTTEGANGDISPSTSIYYRITNLDTVQAVTVTATYLPLEL